MTKQLGVFLVILFLFIGLLAGCGAAKTSDVEAQNENEAQPLPVEEPENEEPDELQFEHAYPLTGEGTDEQITARPIVVMVENSPKARPQSGLDRADIVYEILAEGEITRFVAVYQSEEAEVIGPVRSIRPYFVEIGDDLDGLVVHAGWSSDAKKMLAARKVQHFDAVYGDHLYYWRSQERYAPHNLYTSTEKILAGAEAKRYRTDEWDNPQVKFENEPDALDGSPATKVTIPYIRGYEVTYEYDEARERYVRIMAGDPHLDKETEEQLVADNLIILKAEHRILDNEGRRQVNVNGPGEGFYVRDGKMIDVTWEKVDGIVRIFQENEEVALKPGKTWIQFIQLNSEVTFE